jgi:hypothetical protein
MTQDPFVQAIIDLEVATDIYNADQFRQTRMRKGSRPNAWGPTIAAGLLADVEAAGKVAADEAMDVWNVATPACESGWTGDRCTFALHHDGPHSNE